MGVLEPPIIWILVAVVLVALAALVIVTASLRRARARRAAAWAPAAALGPGRLADDRPRGSADVEPVTVPIDLSSVRVPVAGPETPAPVPAADRDDVPVPAGPADHVAVDPPAATPADDEGDPVVPADPPGPPTSPTPTDTPDAADVPEEEPLAAPLFRPWTMQTRLDARSTGTHPRHAMIDDLPAADAPATADAGSVGTAPDGTASDDTLAMDETAAPVDATVAPRDTAAPHDTAPHAPAESAAKDRLLAVLLRDPQAAVRALAGRGGTGGADPTGADPTGADPTGAGASATDLLRAGLSPSQVSELVGVGEDELASVVARGLGLLGRGQDATGRNRTDDPGRSWANAGSAAGATTPTTG